MRPKQNLSEISMRVQFERNLLRIKKVIVCQRNGRTEGRTYRQTARHTDRRTDRQSENYRAAANSRWQGANEISRHS